MKPRRCPWTGNPCDCNDVEAVVNCPYNPEIPNILPGYDDPGPEMQHLLNAVMALDE